MRKFGLWAGVLLAAGATTGQAALAAEIAVSAAEKAGAEDPAYVDIIDAINEGVNEEAMLDRLIATMADQMAVADPKLIEIEANFPGFSKAISEAMRPAMQAYSQRVTDQYRPRFAAMFAQNLTHQEAADVAAFYRSPLGSKLMGGVVAGYDAKATMASALQQKDVGEGVRTDMRMSVQRGVAALSREDLLEMDRLARRQPVLLKLGTIGPAMRDIRVAMEQENLTPQEEAALTKAVTTAGQAHIAKFKHAPTSKPLP